MQLLLFEETKEERLEREIQALRQQCEKYRKCQFAKIGKIEKTTDETKARLDILESALCKNKLGL